MIYLKEILSRVKPRSVVVLYNSFKFPTSILEEEVERAKFVSEQYGAELKMYTTSKAAIVLSESIEYTDKTLDQLHLELRESYDKVVVLQINEGRIENHDSLIVESALEGDLEGVKSLLFSESRDLDARTVMNSIRARAGLTELKEDIEPIDPLRESYIKGELFEVGQIVEFKGDIFQVSRLGTNYISITDQSGNTFKRWLKDVTLVEDKDGEKMKKFKEFILEDKKSEKEKIKTRNDGYGYHGQHDSDKADDAYAKTHEKVKKILGSAGHLKNIQKPNDTIRDYLDSPHGRHLYSHEDNHEYVAKDFKKFMGYYKPENFKESFDTGLDALEEEHVIYNKKTDSVHKDGFKSKDDAYHHLIDKMEFHPDYTVLHKDEVEGYKKVRAKVKKVMGEDFEPDSLLEASVNKLDKDSTYNSAKDILDQAERDLLAKIADGNKHGHTLKAKNDTVRKMKIKHMTEDVQDIGDLSDKDIDEMVNSVTEDDILSVTEDHELILVDPEDDTFVEEISESEQLDEVLSRAERIKAKARFKRTEAKRERSLKIALKKHSNTKTINNRARRLAVKLVKQRIVKKPLDKLSIGEKERVERIIEKRKAVINRIAMRLAPKIRKIEQDRLEHKSFTKKD